MHKSCPELAGLVWLVALPVCFTCIVNLANIVWFTLALSHTHTNRERERDLTDKNTTRSQLP